MVNEIAISSATQTEPKRLLMPNKLLKAAIDGNETDLRQLLGLNNEQPPPHTNVVVHDGAPTEPSGSDHLRSITGMENSILHILSANGHENLALTICEKDSSLLKARNVRNETPFHHAARFGNKNTILVLIRCAKSAFGVDGLKELLGQKNCLGETALHEAARHGHGAVVSTLMEEDLELAGLVNKYSVSPLYLASARGSVDMVQNMVEKLLHQNFTRDQKNRQRCMLQCSKTKIYRLTQQLLQLYSEPLGKGADETGRTPLHFVASTGNHKIAKLLLDKDPSLAYIRDSDGSFPVHTSVRMGHVKMIVLFLRRCLDSGELIDRNGRNFLHIAIEAKKGHIIIKLLKDSENELSVTYWKEMLNRMANTMDNEGNTPLHLAAKHECIGVMLAKDECIHVMPSLFKKEELDLTLQNKEGLTASDISVIQFREAAINIQPNRIGIEHYIPNRRAGFSTGWFQYYTEKQMPKTEYQVREIEAFRDTMQDHILTAGAGVAKKSSESVMSKAQLVGLGSVLIATITFAAAFTLPGGLDQDTGMPILGGKYIFKAFVLADLSAFFLSIFSTMVLIYSSSRGNSDWMERIISKSVTIFTSAARCMLLTLALGLYLVLDPIGHTGAVVLVFSVCFSFIGSPYGILQPSEGFRLARIKPKQLMKHISIREHLSPLKIRIRREMLNRMANTMDNEGNTPLHLAAKHECIDVMLAKYECIHVMPSLLKKEELDLTLQNKEGLTAADISVIQFMEGAINIQPNRFGIEPYIPNRRAGFSTGWFQYYTEKQMPKAYQVPEIEAIRGTMQDHISTVDARVTRKSSESVMDKAQLVGLGSVLIATVTFAAAFTLPGGTDQDIGTPILRRKYIFKAFVLADFSAFFLSIFSTMVLIYSSIRGNSDWMESDITRSMQIFTLAARCMLLALALGL